MSPPARIAGATAVAATLCLGAAMAHPSAASPPAPRVVGGEPAPAGAYPWMTALVRAGEKPRRGQFCGASLIAPSRLLTAAHCLGAEVTKKVDAIVGGERLSAGDGERIGVSRSALDPGRADLALLKLARPAPAPPLPLAGPEDAHLYGEGDTATVLGWGLTSPQVRRGSDRLRRVDVPIVSDEECARAFQDVPTWFKPDREICAGAPGRDACSGDSGGPLVVDGGAGPIQAGVTSRGSANCGQTRFPGVYAEVPARLEFGADPRPIWAPEPGRQLRIKGRARVGGRLRCSDGRWRGRQLELHFVWVARRTTRRLDEGRIFVPRGEVAGTRVYCIVLAENPGGTSFQQSKTVRIERRR